MKKVNFYFVRDNSYVRSYPNGLKDTHFYCPSLDSALEVAQNLILNGSEVVTIENLGEHELKF